MARRKTMEELLEEAEKGKSGGTLGENIRGREEDKKREEDEKKKKKRGWFSGRRERRTVMNAEA